VLVGGLTIAVFLPSLQTGFMYWDDVENFLRNPHYRGLGWSNLRWMFTSAHLGHYVPITWLTLGLDYVVWGMNPWGYHLTAIRSTPSTPCCSTSSPTGLALSFHQPAGQCAGDRLRDTVGSGS
jgi:hypothetical protein